MKNYSGEFKEKAKLARKKGFNIYSLTNKFKKESGFFEEIPERIMSAVLDEFLKSNMSGSAWPYYKKVLRSKVHEYEKTIVNHDLLRALNINLPSV